MALSSGVRRGIEEVPFEVEAEALEEPFGSHADGVG